MKMLKQVLLLNAVSSGITGLILVIIPATLGSILDTSAVGVIRGTGIFLVCFALLVYATYKYTSVTRLQLIIALDLLWVAGSIALIGFQVGALSLIGYLLVAGVALWVAAMAIGQFIGLRNYAK